MPSWAPPVHYSDGESSPTHSLTAPGVLRTVNQAMLDLIATMDISNKNTFAGAIIYCPRTTASTRQLSGSNHKQLENALRAAARRLNRKFVVYEVTGKGKNKYKDIFEVAFALDLHVSKQYETSRQKKKLFWMPQSTVTCDFNNHCGVSFSRHFVPTRLLGCSPKRLRLLDRMVVRCPTRSSFPRARIPSLSSLGWTARCSIITVTRRPPLGMSTSTSLSTIIKKALQPRESLSGRELLTLLPRQLSQSYLRLSLRRSCERV